MLPPRVKIAHIGTSSYVGDIAADIAYIGEILKAPANLVFRFVTFFLYRFHGEHRVPEQADSGRYLHTEFTGLDAIR